MRARRADWHEQYTLPSLWKFYQPSRVAHGAYWYDWTTQDEIEWKNNYRLWMRFLNEYKNRGGKVCTGSDSGFIFKLYGFDYIREGIGAFWRDFADCSGVFMDANPRILLHQPSYSSCSGPASRI